MDERTAQRSHRVVFIELQHADPFCFGNRKGHTSREKTNREFQIYMI